MAGGGLGKREVGRAQGFSREDRSGEPAGGGVELGEIDALRNALGGVGAEVDEGGRRRGGRLLVEGRGEGLGLREAGQSGKGREGEKESAASDHSC
jgi:hypothetical protein